MSFNLIPPYTKRAIEDVNVKYLSDFVHALGKGEAMYPILRLIEMLKNGFVDGCAVTMLTGVSDPTVPRGPVSIIDWLGDHVQEGSENGGDDQIHVWDRVTDTSYIAFPLSPHGHRLVIWRRGTLFTPDDVATLQILIPIFRLRFPQMEAPKFGIQEQVIEEPENATVVKHETKLFKEIVNSLPDFVLICDVDGKVLQSNQAGEAFFKETIEDMHTNASNSWLLRVCHPDDLKALYENWGEAIQDNTSRKLQCRFLLRKDNYRKFLVRINPIRLGTTGEVHYWAVIGTDLEDDTADDAKTMEKMKGQFLAEISHEIRTPLACVLGTTTLLSHTQLDSDQEELVKTISVSSQQLSNLISDVLDLAKIEESKLVIDIAPICVERVIYEVGDQFRADLVMKHLELLVEISPNLPKWIMSDELRLRQILTNYLSNAIKFSKQDGIVKVSAKAITKDKKNYMEVLVEDEGVGISEAPGSNKLFEKFSQRERSTAKKYGGTGLGLVISKRLIGLLGGETWYKSAVGKGTTFYFTINLEEAWDLKALSSANGDFQCLGYQFSRIQSQYVKNLGSAAYMFEISVEFNHPRVQSHYQKIIGRLPATLVTIKKGSGLEGLTAVSGKGGQYTYNTVRSILITDRPVAVKHLLQSQGNGAMDRIIYVDYECPDWFSKEQKGNVFIKKPLKELCLLRQLASLMDSFTTGPASKAIECSGAVSSSELDSRHLDKDKTLLSSECPLNILVAEDDELNQKLLVRVLGKFGYKDVKAASDGKEAVEAVRESWNKGKSTDIIFMDMQMPVLDGCTASKLIRADPDGKEHRTHIVAMTANAFVEDRDTCLKAGMCDYASKPVKWENLEAILRNAFQAVRGEVACSCQLKK